MKVTPASLIAAILTVITLFALAGFQATTETAGQRFLGRIGAALIGVDRWVPAHREDIDLLARDRPEAPLVLPDFPMEVAIPAAVAIDGTNDSLIVAVTQAMGETLYEDGSGAISDEEGQTHMAATDPVRLAVDMLGRGTHSFWQLVLVVSALVLLAVSAGMVWSRQSPLGAFAIGGGLAAALSLAAWGGAHVLGSAMDSAVDREIALVLRDGAWIGLRNGLAVVAIAGGAIFVLASIFVRHDDDGAGPWSDGDWGDDDWDEYWEEDVEPDRPQPVESLPRRPRF